MIIKHPRPDLSSGFDLKLVSSGPTLASKTNQKTAPSHTDQIVCLSPNHESNDVWTQGFSVWLGLDEAMRMATLMLRLAPRDLLSFSAR